jgi:protocatechuate 3,4-dioxygenase beta subunit
MNFDRLFFSEGKNGIRFRLTVNVLDTTTCSPLENAVVDLWHCDAEGIYSHYIASSLGQFNAAPDNSTFFRGNYYYLCDRIYVFIMSYLNRSTSY